MFVAVYWWRVHPGKEDQFRAAWARGTDLIREKYGSYGSRLHRDADGIVVGYAGWLQEVTRQAALIARCSMMILKQALHSFMPSRKRRPTPSHFHNAHHRQPTCAACVTECLTGRWRFLKITLPKGRCRQFQLY